MYRFIGWIIVLGMMGIGCNSTHKLTGTDYVDLQNEAAPEVAENYPSEIIEEAGWSDITSEEKSGSDDEEFRIWLTSDVYPHHLFKITKEKRNVTGESILYWQRDTLQAPYGTVYLAPRMKKYLDGVCTEFHQTETYGYCYPEIERDEGIDWESVYASVEGTDFWQLGGAPSGNETENASGASKNWKMYVQMRLGSYYRDYAHINPQTYDDAQLRNDIRRLSNAVKQISSHFETPIPTTTFEGITDGNRFVLCDSSETWQMQSELDRLLNRAGLQASIDTQEDSSLYYVMLKGWNRQLWYHEWASSKFDRNFYPNQLYDIRAVRRIKCPQLISVN